MASLFTIDSEIKAIIDGAFDSVDENGEVEVNLEDLLALQEERQVKIENIALYIKNLASEASAIKNEEIILADRRKRLERKCERLEGILMNSLIQNDEMKASSPRFEAKIRYADNTEIEDESLIPEEYLVTKTEVKPDKTAIKKAIKEGKEVAGARIVSVPHINIK